MKTICRDCIFAEWNEGTQNGCSVGNLDKFIKRNEILPANPDEWYATINRMCTSCRNQDWADKQQEDLIVALYKEVKLDYSIIIVENTIDDIEDMYKATEISLKSALSQEPEPKKIIFAIANKDVDRASFANFVKEILKDCGIKWSISYVCDYTAPVEEIIDMSFNKIETMYYTIVENGKKLPCDFALNFDNKINEELEQIIMIEPESNIHGKTFLSFLHHYLHGNKQINLEDKIKNLGDKGIFTWNQIFQQQQ